MDTVRIRLYSTRTLKPLGTLQYHKNGCQSVAFARSLDVPVVEEMDEEMSEEEKEERSRWLIGGGKDGRVSIWVLMNFEKPRKTP